MNDAYVWVLLAEMGLICGAVAWLLIDQARDFGYFASPLWRPWTWARLRREEKELRAWCAALEERGYRAIVLQTGFTMAELTAGLSVLAGAQSDPRVPVDGGGP